MLTYPSEQEIKNYFKRAKIELYLLYQWCYNMEVWNCKTERNNPGLLQIHDMAEICILSFHFGDKSLCV